MRGKYIVIEGNDGTGKSTQVELLAEYLKQQAIDTFVMHEPAGTPISATVREIIKNGDLERDASTNVLLFTACRHENWKRAKVQLEAGKWVISARNYISTEVYQGIGEGFDIDTIHTLTRQFTDELYMQPDHTLVLHVSQEEREKRIAGRGTLENKDTFESRGKEFQDVLDEGYTTIAKKYGFRLIDANRSINEIQNEIRRLLDSM